MQKLVKLVVAGFFCLSVLHTGLVYGSPTQQVLMYGMAGDEVYRFQILLSNLGYYRGVPDGEFGSGTWQAVINFQMDCGLEVDGIVGMDTLKEMREISSGKRTVSRGSHRDGEQLAGLAKQFLGVPYVWAGTTPSGFDCSGFVYYIFNRNNIAISRDAHEQFRSGHSVAVSELEPGDLVFFSTYEPGPSHVGIYIGDGYFIHASSGAGFVTVTPLTKQYYQERYLGARRIAK